MCDPGVREAIRGMAGRALTVAQFALLAALALSVPARRPPWPAVGLLTVAIALGVWALRTMHWKRLSVWPEPKRNTALVCSGPYRWIRHPMYTAAALAAAGLALHAGGLARWLTWLVLVTVLAAKSRLEERHLAERFPEYREYAARTWRWLPGIW
ncbi:MAG: isoprenylcysteine carboxylmethyltransferase family protein [Kiritimatiellae bacterium]|nr:isoprenylcysteine carboxylmethyltransferase family protein [Kiritimatiellia bacterium]